MSSKKAFYGMLGLLVVMSGLVIGSIIIGDGMLKKRADRLVNLKLEADVIEEQQRALILAKKDVEKYADLEAIAKQIVPQDKDQARAVREIVGIAEQAGVSIASVTFPTSNLGQKAAPVKPSTTESETSTAPKPVINPLTQAKPVTGVSGLYELEINVASDPTRPATYTRLIDFLERLEQNRRTAQVGQISIQPDGQNRISLNFTLTVTVYIKP